MSTCVGVYLRSLCCRAVSLCNPRSCVIGPLSYLHPRLLFGSRPPRSRLVSTRTCVIPRQRVQQLEATIVAMQQQGPSTQGIHRETKISLPVKFDGTRSQFRGFLNQIRLVIQMHPSRYPTDASQVGFVGTLLSGSALAWLTPLLEKESPLLNNFEEFLSEFKACFCHRHYDTMECRGLNP